MNWKEITSIDALDEIKEASALKPVLIFKHSTRCSISSASLDRIERRWQSEMDEMIDAFFLDLIAHRDVSNAVASEFGIEHQSPQAIIIKDGKAVYEASHFGIDYEEIKKIAGKVAA